jgi:hypothetical protein
VLLSEKEFAQLLADPQIRVFDCAFVGELLAAREALAAAHPKVNGVPVRHLPTAGSPHEPPALAAARRRLAPLEDVLNGARAGIVAQQQAAAG